MQKKFRTLPFRRVKMDSRGARAVTHLEGNTKMANFEKLIEDVPAELTAVNTFIAGVEKLVTDAKASGLSTITIGDVEALVPDAETVIRAGEAIVADL